jgi:hypothetical protein
MVFFLWLARRTDLYLLFVFVCLFVHFFGTGRAGMCCLFLFVCHCLFFSWLAGRADLYLLFVFVCLFVHFFVLAALVCMWCLFLFVCHCLFFSWLAGRADLYVLFVCHFFFSWLAGHTDLYLLFVFVCLSVHVFLLARLDLEAVCVVCLSVHVFCCWLGAPVGYTCCLFVLSWLFLGDM